MRPQLAGWREAHEWKRAVTRIFWGSGRAEQMSARAWSRRRILETGGDFDGFPARQSVHGAGGPSLSRSRRAVLSTLPERSRARPIPSCSSWRRRRAVLVARARWRRAVRAPFLVLVVVPWLVAPWRAVWLVLRACAVLRGGALCSVSSVARRSESGVSCPPSLPCRGKRSGEGGTS